MDEDLQKNNKIPFMEFLMYKVNNIHKKYSKQYHNSLITFENFLIMFKVDNFV